MDSFTFKSTDNIIPRNGRRITQYIGGVAASMAALGSGVTTSWSASASGHLVHCNKTLEACLDFVVTNEDFSWISALLAIGAMMGAFVSGQVVDRIGRKRLLLILSPISVVGWSMITWATSVWMYDCGRFITGFSSGSVSVAAPMFSSEITETAIRGAVGTFYQLHNVFGISVIYILDYAFPRDFIVLNIVCLILPIILFAAIVFLPETPRFYLLKGNKTESRKSLTFYRGEHYNVEQELEEVEAALNMERAKKIPFFAAMRTAAAKKALAMSVMCVMCQQLSGMCAVVFYATDIFRISGVSIDSKLASVILGVCEILATLASTFLMDRAGRKVLLLVSGGTMSLSSLTLAVYLLLKDQEKLSDIDLGWLPVLCIVVFACSFCIGYGPVPFLYMAEIFPAQIKGPGVAIGCFVTWFFVFITTKFFNSLRLSIQMHGTFFLFSGMTAIGFICILFFLFETKNKSLEEVQDELSGRKFSSKGGKGIF